MKKLDQQEREKLAPMINQVLDELAEIGPPPAYAILRTDGTEETIYGHPTMDAIRQAIGCDGLDVVRIGRANNPPDDLIMMVDDTGALDGKPGKFGATWW